MNNNEGRDPKELRAAPRKKIHSRARVVMGGGKGFMGRAQDISISGVSVLLEEPISSGQLCTIMMDLLAGGKTKQFNVDAKVIYSICSGTAGFRIGFQFINLSSANLSIISALFEASGSDVF